MEYYYGGTAVKSHLAKLQAQQSITLRTIVNASWYVRNEEIRKNLTVLRYKKKYLRQLTTTKEEWKHTQIR